MNTYLGKDCKWFKAYGRKMFQLRGILNWVSLHPMWRRMASCKLGTTILFEPWPWITQILAALVESHLISTFSFVLHTLQDYRYVLDYNNTFGASDLFYQNISGFANMTLWKQSPVSTQHFDTMPSWLEQIFFSLWDMLYVNETIRKRVIGQIDHTTELESSTVIDVEPTTGNSTL